MREVFPTSFRGMVTEKLPAMPHTSWAELDIVFVVKMLYFCLRFSKISFYQTVLLSISAEGRLIGWVLIPLAKRPSSPVLPSEQTCAWPLCSLRNPIAALCSYLVLNLPSLPDSLSCCHKLSKLPVFADTNLPLLPESLSSCY